MTVKRLIGRAEDALAECEARLIWSASSCAAKCADLADAYRSLDFSAVALAARELADEEARLADARIDSDVARCWRDSLRGSESARPTASDMQ